MHLLCILCENSLSNFFYVLFDRKYNVGVLNVCVNFLLSPYVTRSCLQIIFMMPIILEFVNFANSVMISLLVYFTLVNGLNNHVQKFCV